MKRLHLAGLCTSLLLGCAASHAGTVDVVFVHPENFIDIRDADHDAGANLKVLADYFVWLGQKYLPAEKSVHIDVLNVDLAGRLDPTFRWGSVRVVGKAVDWPQISLRYTVQANAQTVTSGEETVSDMAYDMHLTGYPDGEPLAIEKQMLRTWFRKRFAAP
jgi:hypothetical protein